MNHDASRSARAIVHGQHPDPFSFLGPHEESGKKVVRAFLPGATAIEVVSAGGERLGALANAHPDGLFAGFVDGAPADDYRLKATWPDGSTSELHDPYRFPTTVSDFDLYLFGEGNHNALYDMLGAHLTELDGVGGVRFAVWAPNARRVSVIGDFNGWDGRVNAMRNRSGVWEMFVPGVKEGDLYKFEVVGENGALLPQKADPFGLFFEQYPGTASIVSDPSHYGWTDDEWMRTRAEHNALDAPMSVYEVHLGSWKKRPDGSYLLYDELAAELVPYVKDLGYTHVEFLPLTEHPFGGSWGYQPLGLYAPTSRFGTPYDFRKLVDEFHRAGIGVIMDWVPAHFPEDAHGLANFDGTHLYDHSDPRLGRHPDWGTAIFNYGRNEVRNYLTANALFWLREYHIDGLRVDAVASMLYLDYSRKEGEWVPNVHGGNENLEAIAFLKKTNELVYSEAAPPGAFTVAEESTSWPMVSRPTSMGGLGFGYKWNMGWMHDSLEYIQQDPMYRAHHHNELTFSLIYAFNENFVLPLSHDEVVHGKKSVFGRMPGDNWQKFANLRAYYGFMYTHPGKQLLFMGSEFGQGREWNHDTELDWYLLDNKLNAGTRDFVRDLNAVYKETPALYRRDFDGGGFEWLVGGDSENSVVAFLRRASDPEDLVLCVSNFTPVVRENYRIGVPQAGLYREILNSDGAKYGGSGVENGRVPVEEAPEHGKEHSVSLTLPPLSTVVLHPVR
ncbi:1,4-alpha-glucan branching protein GlgB [Rubrobacter indicoceani]|uniref:1,4-alpha-glucan branching protein GlgB n=1 Tax=Rubrobacter indicoceani TaxID=2051957 RepID=UPI000E5B84DB|nr:1,4-alpha-glucan branching protein GlgB [Rubrobacter indicoceani]